MLETNIIQEKPSAAINCPVDFVKIDENRVRLTAIFVLLLAVLYLIAGNPLIIAILLADFCLRAFNLNSYSPLAIVSSFGARQIGLQAKPVDRAPKRFAAFVGMVFLSGVLIFSFTGFILTSKIVALVVVVFAGLEGFLGFCAGCYVYSFLNRFKRVK